MRVENLREHQHLWLMHSSLLGWLSRARRSFRAPARLESRWHPVRFRFLCGPLAEKTRPLLIHLPFATVLAIYPHYLARSSSLRRAIVPVHVHAGFVGAQHHVPAARTAFWPGLPNGPAPQAKHERLHRLAGQLVAAPTWLGPRLPAFRTKDQQRVVPTSPAPTSPAPTSPAPTSGAPTSPAPTGRPRRYCHPGGRSPRPG